MAKQKLTPTKEKEKEKENDNTPLTPAQAIIREAKMKDKDDEPVAAEEDPDDTFIAPRPRKQSWFSPKNSDNGHSPGSHPVPLTPPTRERGLSVSPAISGSRLVSPITPPRVPESSQTRYLNLTPSPAAARGVVRPLNERAPQSLGATSFPTLGSTSTTAPSLYVQYNPASGTVDLAGTLLTVAARFEKLEKWTVNHVRALEERMKDVEK